MTNCNPQLLDPLTLPCGTTLKNRLVMAPMTTCAGFHEGSVTRELVEYYRQRAGDAAAIIVECAFVEDNGPAFPGRSVSIKTVKSTVWQTSPVLSKSAVQKQFCKFIMAVE
ncbi:N-ethylmaleimide reductase [Tatumella ptyseos]|uniref:N-ethylmaleimide reductase n=1 Tax=Tatumella ptyseos TaxID=82987 RepID=A0A2X5NFI0_9GAMM|nr:N-ethylmaleimide reductase [Tatumella ptyseos]